jgi:hypothetical protein
LLEEIGLRADQLEAQAFFAPAPDMDGCDLAALDTLPHGLPGNAQQAHGLVHGEATVRSFFGDARAQVGGEANAPRRTVSELLASDDAIVEPAMNRRGCDTERGCRLFDGQQFTLRRVVRTFEAGDVSLARGAAPRSIHRSKLRAVSDANCCGMNAKA